MADSVKIKITGDSKDFEGKLKSVGNSASSVFKGMMAAQIVTKGLSMMTSELKSAIGTAMDFEAAMSQVAAISGATGEELNKLTETAKYYGETTKFTASQAAEALNYMALAGWDATQSIDALGGVLNLAAASGMDLGAASDAVTDYLSAFGMEASKATYMADLMAYAQAKSNTTATMLADAYGNCASSMHAAGQDIETTTSFLMALANQGIKGSEAGTQMAAVMRDLTSKMKNGQIMIGNTAVQVADAAGNFRDLNDIMVDVSKATAGMGTAEQSAALMTTFTARSVKAVQTVMNAGIESVNEYEAALRDSAGTATAQSETMLDNLQGDVTIFQSALEGLRITAGESVNDTARSLVQQATDILGALNQGGKNNGISGIFDAAIDLIPTLVPKATSGLQRLLQGVAKKLPALVKNLVGTIPNIISGAADLMPGLIDAVFQSASAIVEGLVGRLPELVPAILKGIANTIPAIARGVFTMLDGLTNGIAQAFHQGQSRVQGMWVDILGVETMKGEITAEIDITTAETNITNAYNDVISAFNGLALTDEQKTEINNAISQGYQAVYDKLVEFGIPPEQAAILAQRVTDSNDTIAEAFDKLDLSVDGATIAEWAREAQRSSAALAAMCKAAGLSETETQQILDEFEKMNGKLQTGTPSIFTTIYDALTDGLPDTPEQTNQLAEQINAYYDAALKQIEDHLDEEIAKLDPDSEGYQEKCNALVKSAETAKAELVALRDETTTYLTTMSGKSTADVKDSLDELAALEARWNALTASIQAANEAQMSKGENAFEVVRSGANADEATIGIAIDFVADRYKLKEQSVQDQYDAAIAELNQKLAEGSISAEEYNAQAAEVKINMDTAIAEAKAVKETALAEILKGISESEGNGAMISDAVSQINLVQDVIDMLLPPDGGQIAVSDLNAETFANVLPKETLQEILSQCSQNAEDDLNALLADNSSFINEGAAAERKGEIAGKIIGWLFGGGEGGTNTDALSTAITDASPKMAQAYATMIETGIADGTKLVTEGGSNPLAAVFADLATTVEETEPTITDAATTAVSGVADAVDVSDDTYKSGVNGMQGLIDGAASKRAAVVSMAKSLARSFLSAFNKGIEVNSPSKAFMRSGVYSGEGYEIGFKKSMNRAIANVKGITGNLISAANYGASYDFSRLERTVSSVFTPSDDYAETPSVFINGKLVSEVNVRNTQRSISAQNKNNALGVGIR